MIDTSKKSYEKNFEEKKELFREAFSDISEIEYFASPPKNFRYRAEFNLLKLEKEYAFGMTLEGKKEPVGSFPIASTRIQELMPCLLNHITKHPLISEKLFQVEFQSTRNSEIMVSLIYHKKIDEIWYEKASEISSELGISLIGRSRKQRLIVGNNYVTEIYNYNNKKFSLKLYEQCFSQTNPYICDDMLDWVARNSADFKKDIVELHCGLGTFTILLSNLYQKVLATENSRPSIKALEENIRLNNKQNIYYGRLSGKETIEALREIRPYQRLSSVNLNEFEIDSIFLDPPREGLDQFTRDNIVEMENIIYISCGFESFRRDITELQKTHQVVNLAMFDQFPYTDHIESGAILRRKAPD